MSMISVTKAVKDATAEGMNIALGNLTALKGGLP